MAEAKFEKDLERLEKLVEALEEGGLPLDDALKKFEEGIKLARRCEDALNAAEKKIEILTKNSKGELNPQPFGETEDESAGSGESEHDEGKDEADAGEDADEEEGGLLF